jgi:hypothetical protein
MVAEMIMCTYVASASNRTEKCKSPNENVLELLYAYFQKNVGKIIFRYLYTGRI